MSLTTPVVVGWAGLVAGLLLLAYTYAGYPLLSGLLARFARPAPDHRSIEPRVSLIILALNEEANIARKIENSLSLDYPRDRLEIIVASDGSTDGTNEIVERYAAQGVRLFAVPEHRGKTTTTTLVVPTARGEILLFSDATGQFSRTAVRKLAARFADPGVGAVVGRVAYRYGASVTAQGFKSYQRYVVAVRRQQSAFGTGTTASGSICAIRREMFRAVSGDLDYDMAHPLHVALEGKRTVYEPDAVSEEEAREHVGGEFQARVRMAIQVFSFLPYLLRRLPSCKNRSYVFQVLSLKVLRWISPFLLLLVLALGAILAPSSPPAFLLLAAQLAVYAAALLAYLLNRLGYSVRLLALPLFFVTINLAFLYGFGRWLVGSPIRGWRPDR